MIHEFSGQIKGLAFWRSQIQCQGCWALSFSLTVIHSLFCCLNVVWCIRICPSWLQHIVITDHGKFFQKWASRYLGEQLWKFFLNFFLSSDYERVISHHIQHEGYSNALDVLRKPRNVELFYKFSPVLMQHIPQGLCQAWIELGRDLDPKRLIPALVQLDHSPEKNQVRCNQWRT